MPALKHQRLWFFFTVICLFLACALTVSAQAAPTLITIGQNMTGNITDPATPLQFSISVAAPQSVNIQVLAISPQGFAPTFRVLDPSGAVVLDAANPGTLASVQGSPNLSSPGTYLIEVSSSNNTAGQFLLAVQPGAPLAPPTPLTPGQPVTASVDATTTRQAYSFTGSQTDVQLLDVTSASTSSGPVITLRSADTGETLALATALMAGANFRIPLGTTNYLLEVTSSGGATAESVTICLATESGAVTCPSSGSTSSGSAQIVTLTPTPEVVTATQIALIPTSVPPPTIAAPVIDPNGSCEVTPTNGTPDNVRMGPDTSFAVLVQLPVNQTAQVIGRLGDNSWLQINYGGMLGWISTTVVMIGGNCGGVVVVAPPAPPPAPTIEAPTGMPTNTPTPPLIIIPIASNTPSVHFPPVQIAGTLHLQLIPTNTPTPLFHIVHPIIITAQCPGDPPKRLQVGGQGTVIVAVMPIYSQASASSTVIDTQQAGLDFIVEGGPTCADNYTWWHVKYDGGTKSGWIPEGVGSTYFVEPQ